MKQSVTMKGMRAKFMWSLNVARRATKACLQAKWSGERSIVKVREERHLAGWRRDMERSVYCYVDNLVSCWTVCVVVWYTWMTSLPWWKSWMHDLLRLVSLHHPLLLRLHLVSSFFQPGTIWLCLDGISIFKPSSLLNVTSLASSPSFHLLRCVWFWSTRCASGRRGNHRQECRRASAERSERRSRETMMM